MSGGIELEIGAARCLECGELVSSSTDISDLAGVAPHKVLEEVERRLESAHMCSTPSNNRLVVLSTGYAPSTAGVCRRSVNNQTLPVQHVWIDAAHQPEAKAAAENFYTLCSLVPPEVIVVWLDLDDWLAGPAALKTLRGYYDRDPKLLATYGSYSRSDGKPGIARAYAPDENVRSAPWGLSHLKTFRAGLVHRIRPEDLKLPDGRWTHRAVDCAFMFPIAEMAGHDRMAFVQEDLYVYHYDASFEASASDAELREEIQIAAHFRGKAPYARIEEAGA